MPQNLDNVLLVAPTRKFLDLLPGGGIPERGDFVQYKGRKFAANLPDGPWPAKRSEVITAEFP